MILVISVFTKDDFVVTSLDGNDHIFTKFRHEDVYIVDFTTRGKFVHLLVLSIIFGLVMA